jgi:hypothetical protein
LVVTDDYKGLAVFTIVQEEPEFVHPWINHYKKHVADPGDLYVLVHPPTPLEQGPADDTASAWTVAQTLIANFHGVTVVPVHHASAFDHRWLAATGARFQSFLLQSYRWVLFAECDEFVLPTPSAASGTETLVDFVARLGSDPPPAVRATGFEVVQQQGESPLPAELYQDGGNIALTAGRMIQDCHFWYRSSRYSKTLLARIPMKWKIGFHRARGPAEEVAQAAPSPFLTLVHLHKVDFALALARSRRSTARRWSKTDIERRAGWQNRIDDATALRDFWQLDQDTNLPMQPGRLTPILPGIKQWLG